ncbi:MAG: EamA family transporter [Cyanobium sp. RS427]|nr:EamA family transporter [Cyanobium sp. RS427]|tara:strand:- start:687 stop:1529 length:843 start_codon:yes stop_codon:yes gene_type:complete
MTGQLAAIGAALSWTLASGLWRSVSGAGSALTLNGLKNGLACLLFLPVLLTIPWLDNKDAVIGLLLSGAIGIAAGDSFYLAALRRLGTRRTLTVEALGPVLASIGSVVMMGEMLSSRAWIGAALVTVAVMLVAGSGEANSRDSAGVLLALTAVICGLTGAFLARQVLISSGLSPIQTAAIRLLGGWLALLPVLGRSGGSCWPMPATGRIRILVATALGTNLGIALQQLVFQQMAVGPGVTLMSTAPVMALCIGHWEGDPIQARGVVAAGLAVAGVACISL